MAHKRKRSESTLPPFTALGSAKAGSRDASSSFDTPVISAHPMSFSDLQETSNEFSHLHSRTRKRFRDNRPDESTIHKTTYEKLLSAARSPPPDPARSITPPVLTEQACPELPPRRTSGQSSLHNFWLLPNSVPSVRSSVSSIQPAPTFTCEDCDACFTVTDACVDTCMGGVGDDNPEMREYGCKECRKLVCDSCAVVEAGIGRECLSCRTSMRKRWVGGIGWMV